MDTNIEYASSLKRGLAIVIDIFIVLFLRIIAAQLLIFAWLNRVLQEMTRDYKDFFETEIIENRQQIDFLISHDGFKDVILFYILLFLVGAFYHSYLNSSNWQATIGKRIMKIIMINKNFEKASFLRAFCHYVLSLVPILIMLYLIFFQANNQMHFLAAITDNAFNIFITFIAAIWINIHIFTNKKITLYDLICKVNIAHGKTNYKYPNQKNV